MLAEIMREVMGAFNWILLQLGWDIGSLSWVHIVLLVLAAVGALIVVRNLLGGSRGGGGGSSVVYPPTRRERGLPTSVYTGSKSLGDFSVPKEVYNFKVPTPTPNLSRLREPLGVDVGKAVSLFVMPQPTKQAQAPKPAGPVLNMELARKLFLPGGKQ